MKGRSTKINKETFIFLAITVFFALYFFVWSILKPYNYGPDEYARFPAIYYMFKYNTLPSGWLEKIRNPLWGFSYAFYYTWLPSLLSTLCMKITSIFTTSPDALVIAARFPNVIAGALTIFFCGRTVTKISENKKVNYFIILLIGFLPQLAFLSSYVNNDSLAVLGASVICYAWACGLKDGWNIKICITLAVGISITALSYYNAYGWILLSVFLFYISFIIKRPGNFVSPDAVSNSQITNASGKANKPSGKEIFRFTLIIVGVVFLICGFFVIRNAVIYGDLFGIRTLNESSEIYAIPELKPSMRPTLKNAGGSFLSLFKDVNWIVGTLKSSIAVFGYMMFEAPSFVIVLFSLLLFAGFAGFITDTVIVISGKENTNGQSKDTARVILFRIMLFSAFLIPVFLSMYYSYGTDYQPQGRYIFSLLPALVCFETIGYNRIFKIPGKNTKKILSIILIIISALVMFSSLYTFFKVYVPSEFGSRDTLTELINML